MVDFEEVIAKEDGLPVGPVLRLLCLRCQGLDIGNRGGDGIDCRSRIKGDSRACERRYKGGGWCGARREIVIDRGVWRVWSRSPAGAFAS